LAYQIKLADGTELICSSEHRWLTKRRGWKYTTGSMAGENQRPYLTTTNSLLGYGKIIASEPRCENPDYKKGYLCGIIRGDGTIGHYKHKRGVGEGEIHLFRLAMKETEALDRATRYLSDFGISVYRFDFLSHGTTIPAIRTNKKYDIQKIEELICFCDNNEFRRGFLAGIYDAEGTSGKAMRIANKNQLILDEIEKSLDRFNIPYVFEDAQSGTNHDVSNIRILGGKASAIYFRQFCDVAIHSKFDITDTCFKSEVDTQIVSIKPLNCYVDMYDITTTTENFIANGVVSHNCFAPNVLHRDKEKFHSEVFPRENIVDETIKQLCRENITGKLVHLCFTCDPFPRGAINISPTRDIIFALKQSGNHVQILTKNGADAPRVFDLLDGDDWYGVTLDGAENNPYASSTGELICSLIEAHRRGIKTWVSFEPVVNAERVLELIREVAPYVDKVKIGKLNYHPSNIDWAEFGREAETLCKMLGLDYYIKDSLRACMEKETNQ